MSYTYPEALTALESIANDYIKLLRPNETARVRLVCEVTAQTASVTWDHYEVKVTMPVRPAASVMLQTEFEDWTAYLLHELGHPTHTDKAAWVVAVKAGVSRMVNALEDVRMEKALIASGIVPNAKAVLSRLVSRKMAEARANGWKPNARKEFGWTVCVLGRAANGYAIEASDLAWVTTQIKPASTVAAVLAWALPALTACHSTADCVELAKRILAALATAQVPQGLPINPNPGTDEDEGEGEGGFDADDSEAYPGQNKWKREGEKDQDDAGEPAGEGKGEGDQTTGESEKPPGDAPKPSNSPSGDNGEGDSDAGKGGKGHGDGTTDADETPIADDDLIERDMSPQGEAMGTGQGAAAEKAVVDILRGGVMADKPRREITGSTNTAGQHMRQVATQCSRQRALLARALRANETDDREGGRKAGRLDRGALSRAMAGAPNVFARREVSEGYDTDVCVLLDASGSMAGWNMQSALETGLVIAQAAGSVGASCTTEIFNSQGYSRAGTLASKRTPNPGDYGALVNAATGGTPLSAHMARAAVSQAKRAPHKRRVLFVVTDGQCDHGPATVRRMASYLEKTHGTIMAHVSIGTPLSGSFRAEVRVPIGTSLAELGLEHFVKVLQAL